MNLITFRMKLKSLKQLLAPKKLSKEQKEWVNYFNWNCKRLSPQNLVFIDIIISKNFNINELSKEERKEIKLFFKYHKKNNIVFDTEQKLNWFVYLDFNLAKITESNVQIIENISKEKIYPKKLDKQEKLLLKKLIEIYLNDNKTLSLKDQFKYILRVLAFGKQKLKDYLSNFIYKE